MHCDILYSSYRVFYTLANKETVYIRIYFHSCLQIRNDKKEGVVKKNREEIIKRYCRTVVQECLTSYLVLLRDITKHIRTCKIIYITHLYVCST